MTISCEEVQREISNYFDGETDASLRARIEEHLRGCARCKAVLDGIRNVVRLYGDERLTEVPPGFSQRLHQMLDANMPGGRRSFLQWTIAAAAAVLALGSFEAARSSIFDHPELRSEHAQAGAAVPPDLQVVVSAEGKMFHRPWCPFIHDKTGLRTLMAREAMKEGYTPCVRCMKEYLRA